MKIGNLNLNEKWLALANQRRFTRRHTDGKLNIEYGVEEKAGAYEFFVKGTDDNHNVVATDFLRSDVAGIFRKQFNRLRRLRPGGQDRQPGKQLNLLAGAEACGFYCQNPDNPLSLLVRPLLGTLDHRAGIQTLNFRWNVYPNLAPFEPGGHLLLVPTSEFPELPHFPQMFTKRLMEDYFSICQQSTDLLIFFNSRHAGATQDHFHLQAVFCKEVMPIAQATRTPFGIDGIQYVGDNYPVTSLVYGIGDVNTCSDHVKKLQISGIPFNILFTNGVFFLVPRDINNEIVAEFPNVLASMETAGKFIIPDLSVFTRATEGYIRMALQRIGLSRDDIQDVLKKE